MKNKILENVMWGVSAVAGFIIAERIQGAAMKAIDKSRKTEEIDISEEESE